MSSWLDEFPGGIAQLDTSHLRRQRRVIAGAEGVRLQVDGHTLLCFCSNDYLGLAQHPTLIEAACTGVKNWGVGAGASPLVSGHSAAAETLELQLAQFVQLPRALSFYAGYAANVGIIPALVGPGDAIFSDELNHACLIDGARLSRAQIHRYGHTDLMALQAALSQSTAPRKLVLSDAVFSMDGDLADIPTLLDLCERYDALLLLDDAHGFGVLGPQGRGTLAHYGLTGVRSSRRVLYMATLGKAAGVAGAFVAGNNDVIEWLMQKTRSYMFATAAPAFLSHTLSASLQLIEQEQWRREHLQKLVARLRRGLSRALLGCIWRLMPSSTAIQPLLIGRSENALAAMQALYERGLWVPAIRPPTVAQETARLRISLSAAHTLADVDELVQALHELARE